MLFMQGFVFLEEIIMNNGLPVIYDYMMTRRSFSGCGVTILAIDFSYNILIQTDVESQVYVHSIYTGIVNSW